MTLRFRLAQVAPVLLGVVILGCSPPSGSNSSSSTPPPQTAPNPPLPSDQYEAGKVEAIRDIKNGLYVEITYGKVPAWIPQYQAIMKTNYNVDVVVEDIENISAEMIDRIRGYNEVSVPEIERLHGEGVLKRAAEKAEQMLAASPPAKDIPESESKRAEAVPAALPVAP